MTDQSEHSQPAETPSLEGATSARHSSSSRRMIILLGTLIVLACLYPVVHPRLQAWRQQLAGDSPHQAVPLGAGDPPSTAGSRTGGAILSPPAPSVAVSPKTPDASLLFFAELPATKDERLRVLREEALRTATRLVESVPDQPRRLALLATMHNRFGEAAKAEQVWRQCLAVNPRDAEAYSGLGTIAKARGDYQTAVEHLTKALEVAPSIAEVRTELGDALMKLTRMAEAVSVLEEEVRRFPTSVAALYYLGQSHLQLQEYDKAIVSFEAALREDPQCAYAYYGLATACRRLGQAEKSAEAMQKFKRFKATDLRTQRDATRTFDDEEEVRRAVAFAHVTAGNICADAGSFRDAEAHWRRALAVDPRDTASRSQLARLYDRQNRLADAITVLEELRTVEPDNPLHCLNLGMAHLRRNDLSAAEKAYRMALEAAPQSATGYATLAAFLLRTGRQSAEARAMAEKAVELEPTGQYYALLCAICQQLGDAQSALTAIDRAHTLEPDNPTFQQVRAKLERDSRKDGGQ